MIPKCKMRVTMKSINNNKNLVRTFPKNFRKSKLKKKIP